MAKPLHNQQSDKVSFENKKFYMTSMNYYMTEMFKVFGMEKVESPDDADLIVFNNSRNVPMHPMWFGQEPITIANKHLYNFELDFISYAMFHKYPNKLKLGFNEIGNQIVAACNKADIWQFCSGHTSQHLLRTHDYGSAFIESNHTSLINLEKHKQYRIIGWSYESTILEADKRTVRPKREINSKDGVVDPEIVYFPGTNSIVFYPITTGMHDKLNSAQQFGREVLRNTLGELL